MGDNQKGGNQGWNQGGKTTTDKTKQQQPGMNRPGMDKPGMGQGQGKDKTQGGYNKDRGAFDRDDEGGHNTTR